MPPVRHAGATVNVDLATPPIDATAPKAPTGRPTPQGIGGAEGDSGRKDAGGDVTGLWEVIRGVVGIWPFAIDDCGIIIGHVDGVGVGRRDGDDLLILLLPDRDVLLAGRLQLVGCICP